MRHGETVGQSSIRYHGRTDVALSELGRRQMAQVRAALSAEVFDAVYTSPLVRARGAADIVAPHLPARAVAGFTEIDFGDWEGLTREEIAARAPADYARWRAAVGEFTYPGGDAVPAFRGRVVAALRQVLAAAPERVLVVAHKGVIASVLQELLGLSPEARASWAIDLASIHVVESTAEGWRCTVANEVRHLEGAP